MGITHLLTRAVAWAIGDSSSFELCSAFGCNTYRLTLLDIENHGDGTVTVTWERERLESDVNALGQVDTEVFIAGQSIGGEFGINWSDSPFTTSATGSGAAGDAVEVVASTDEFDGGEARVSGTVPEPESGFDPELVSVPTGECNVAPTDVQPPAEVELSAIVWNYNDVPAAATVEWTWAGEQIATAGVNVSQRSTELATAFATIDREGRGQVRAEVTNASESVEGLHPARSPSVVPGVTGHTTSPEVVEARQASIEVVEIFPPFDPVVGDSVAAAVSAENTGDATGSRTVDAVLNGTVVDTLTFDIDAGGSQSLSAFFTVEQAGENTLTVGEQTVTFQVSESGQTAGLALNSCSPGFGDRVEVGELGGMAVSIENNTDQEQTVALEYRAVVRDPLDVTTIPTAGGKRNVDYTVAAGDTIRPAETYEWPDLDQPDGTEVEINAVLRSWDAWGRCGTVVYGGSGFSAGNVTVPTDECSVSPRDVVPPETIDLSATVRNRNDVPAAATVEWTWSREQLATASVDVPQNGAETATASGTIDREGQGQVQAAVISASESAASSVRAPAVKPVRAGASNEVSPG